jgi:hypothetical protein
MSIRRWRHVESTDDGCNVYQCLSCYQSYEGRDCPSFWKFCPYCGVEWEGQHKWLVYDDKYNIIEPARLRTERRVSKAEPRWHTELQEMTLFLCDDGSYVPLHDGGHKDKWSSIYNTDYLLGHPTDDEFKMWRLLSQSLGEKYGARYGSYIYYKRFISNLLKSVGDDKFLWFSCGGDFRLKSTLVRSYNDVVQERIIDLGGWRKGKDKKYKVRSAGVTYKTDDLESTWQDHGH